jgi:hypothetical protein
MPANVKGALLIALGYVAMIAAAVAATLYIRKAKQENQNKPADKYDLVGRITDYIFKDIFK